MKRILEDFWKVEQNRAPSFDDIRSTIEKALEECDVRFMMDGLLDRDDRNGVYFRVELFLPGGRPYGELEICGPEQGFFVHWLPKGVRREEMVERRRRGLGNSFTSGMFGKTQPWEELPEKLPQYIKLIYKGTGHNNPYEEQK